MAETESPDFTFANLLLDALVDMARRSHRAEAELATAMHRAGLASAPDTTRSVLNYLLEYNYIDRLVPLSDGGLLLRVTHKSLELKSTEPSFSSGADVKPARRSHARSAGDAGSAAKYRRRPVQPPDPLDQEPVAFGYYRSTIEGRWVNVNKYIAEMNGYKTEAELINAVNSIPSECYVNPNLRAEMHEKLLRDGFLSNVTYQVYRHRTREPIWVNEDIRLVVSEATGKPLYYEGRLQEIPGPHNSEKPSTLRHRSSPAVSADIPSPSRRVTRHVRFSAPARAARAAWKRIPPGLSLHHTTLCSSIPIRSQHQRRPTRRRQIVRGAVVVRIVPRLGALRHVRRGAGR